MGTKAKPWVVYPCPTLYTMSGQKKIGRPILESLEAMEAAPILALPIAVGTEN